MVQQAKRLAIKPDDWNLTPGTHLVEGEERERTPTNCPLTSAHILWCVHPHHTEVNFVRENYSTKEQEHSL